LPFWADIFAYFLTLQQCLFLPIDFLSVDRKSSLCSRGEERHIDVTIDEPIIEAPVVGEGGNFLFRPPFFYRHAGTYHDIKTLTLFSLLQTKKRV
jgi:hypothetical protein